MNRFDFTLDDIDDKTLTNRAAKESRDIYFSNSRRGRSKKEVYETSRYGLAAEVFLLQQGYLDDVRKYRDLKDKNEDPIEIKVTKCEPWIENYTIPYCVEGKLRNRGDYPNFVYAWTNNRDKDEETYTFRGVWKWDFHVDNFVKMDLQSIENLI